MVDPNSCRMALLSLVAVPALAFAGEPMEMTEHMDDDPWQSMVLLDQFEWQDAEEGDALAWDRFRAWRHARTAGAPATADHPA